MMEGTYRMSSRSMEYSSNRQVTHSHSTWPREERNGGGASMCARNGGGVQRMPAMVEGFCPQWWPQHMLEVL